MWTEGNGPSGPPPTGSREGGCEAVGSSEKTGSKTPERGLRGQRKADRSASLRNALARSGGWPSPNVDRERDIKAKPMPAGEGDGNRPVCGASRQGPGRGFRAPAEDPPSQDERRARAPSEAEGGTGKGEASAGPDPKRPKGVRGACLSKVRGRGKARLRPSRPEAAEERGARLFERKPRESEASAERTRRRGGRGDPDAGARRRKEGSRAGCPKANGLDDARLRLRGRSVRRQEDLERAPGASAAKDLKGPELASGVGRSGWRKRGLPVGRCQRVGTC